MTTFSDKDEQWQLDGKIYGERKMKDMSGETGNNFDSWLVYTDLPLFFHIQVSRLNVLFSGLVHKVLWKNLFTKFSSRINAYI